MLDLSRYYEIDGMAYDRITCPINFFKDPGLVNYIAKVGLKESNRNKKFCGKIGTRFDALVKQEFLSGKPIELVKKDGPEVRAAVEAWQRFRFENPWFEITNVDVRVVNHNLQVAGTLDIKAVDKRNGRRMVVELKVTGDIDWKYWIQTGTYNWCDGESCHDLAVVRLHRILAYPQFEVRPYAPVYRDTFTAMLSTYRHYMQEHPEYEDDDFADEEVGEESQLDEPKVSLYRPGRNW